MGLFHGSKTAHSVGAYGFYHKTVLQNQIFLLPPKVGQMECFRRGLGLGRYPVLGNVWVSYPLAAFFLFTVYTDFQ
jgi:hypothetical protein